MPAGNYLQAVIALVFVLALIGGIALLARRFGFGLPTPALGGRNRRVAIVETAMLDAKRRLVLVRRDSTEHLILLGPASETVVEGGIAAPPPPPAPPAPGRTPA